MVISRWGFISFIITVLTLSACNIQNNSLSNKKKSENPATERLVIEDNFGIQSIKSNALLNRTLTKSNTDIKLPDVNPLKLEGELKIGGSSTLYFLTKGIAERFIEEGYPGKVDIASSGSDKGFELFCKTGKLDIVSAYGPISNEQIQACNRTGIVPIGFQVATDSLTVVVSSQNDFLPTNLSRKDLKKILTLDKWSDVNKDWPSRPIKRIVYPAPWTGSSALFARNILNGNVNQVINAPNTRLYEFEEEVVQEALINPDIIGIIGYAYYRQNRKDVRAISIDGIAPSSTKQYPFVTPMYIYTDTKKIRTRPEVEAFINFYLQNADDEVENANSLAAEETALNASKLKFIRELGRAK